MSHIATVAQKNNLEAGEFLNLLNRWSFEIATKKEKTTTTTETTQVFALRVKAGIFGCNAPDYKTLPSSMVGAYPNWDKNSPQPLAVNKKRIFVVTNPGSPPTILPTFESRDINYDNLKGDKGRLIYLDNVYSSIVPSSESNDSSGLS